MRRDYAVSVGWGMNPFGFHLVISTLCLKILKFFKLFNA